MRCLAVLACLLLAVSAGAGDKLQPIPSLTGPVVDLTHTLSASQQQQLSQKLLSLHQKYGAQMQVLIIASSAPEDAFSYSMRVVDEWKLGGAEKDDGLLLFIAKDDRRSWIQVGYGLEGTIPDVVASRLQSDVMTPYFKQGDFYGGINAVVDGVYARVSGDASLASAPASNANGQMGESVLVFAFFIFAGLHTLRALFGRPLAVIAGAPLGFLAGWLIAGMPLLAALMMVVILSAVALAPAIGGTPGRGYRSGGWGGGGHSGGFGGGGGGGWSGGGGGFGGGGAGGRW